VRISEKLSFYNLPFSLFSSSKWEKGTGDEGISKSILITPGVAEAAQC